MTSRLTNGSASQRYRGDAARRISHHLTLTLSWKEREPWPKSSRRCKKHNASCSGRKEEAFEITEPFGLRRPRLLRGHLEACPEPLEGPVPEFFSSLLRGGG